MEENEKRENLEFNENNNFNTNEQTQNTQYNNVSSAGFKTIPNPANKVKKVKKESKAGFGKTVVLPFLSGAIGCAVVLGTVICIPEIKNKVFPTTATISSSPSSNTRFYWIGSSK